MARRTSKTRKIVYGVLVVFLLAFNFSTYWRIEILKYLGLYFWTGFLQDALNIAEHYSFKKRIEITALLERWDVAAEIYEKEFFSTLTVYHSNNTRDEHTFLLGIRALMVNGQPDKALDYVRNKWHPGTEAEYRSQQRIIAMNTECIERKRNQSEYIELALNLAKDFDMLRDDSPETRGDPGIHFCYSGFFLVACLQLLVYSWKHSRGKWRIMTVVPILLIIAERKAWFTYHDKTPLFRTLNIDVRLESKVTAWWNPDRPSPPSLERARQLFLRLPYVCADLTERTAMMLVKELLLTELERCRRSIFPKRRELPAIAQSAKWPCSSTHKVALTAAAMMHADRSNKFTYRTEWLYNSIEYIMAQANRMRHAGTDAASPSKPRYERIVDISDDFLWAILGDADRGRKTRAAAAVEEPDIVPADATDEL